MSRRPLLKSKRIDLMASQADEMNLQKASQRLGTQKVSETIFASVEKAANKIEYGCDRPAIQDTLANIEYCQKHIEAFIEEFKTLTGQVLTIVEISNCLKGIGELGAFQILETAIKELVTETLYQQLVREEHRLTVTYDNVQVPDLSRLFELSHLLNNAPRIKMHFFGVFWSAYEITEEGQVNIIQAESDRLTDSYRFVASGPDELRKLSVVQSICDSLNSALKDAEIVPDRIFSLVFYDAELKRFCPSGSYIKYNLQPKIIFEHYGK